MIRRIARQLYTVGETVGFSAAVRNSSWRGRRLLILCWHGISLDDEHRWRPLLYITPALFRKRLQILAEEAYNVLPLDEALGRLWSGDLPPRSVAITFDDGFYDFALHAVPILEEFGFPATLYLTTYYVDHQMPIFNLMVPYLLWKSYGPDRRLPDGSSLTSGSEADLAAQLIVEKAVREGATSQEKDRIAGDLAAELGVDYQAILSRRLLHLMSPDEVRGVAASPRIAIEAHTHRHRMPTDPQLVLRELRDNQDRIEQLTGRRPVHFCYPSGEYHDNSFPLLEQQQFKSATSCQRRMAAPSDHPFLVPRLLDDMTLDDRQYRGWLSGMCALGRD